MGICEWIIAHTASCILELTIVIIDVAYVALELLLVVIVRHKVVWIMTPSTAALHRNIHGCGTAHWGTKTHFQKAKSPTQYFFFSFMKPKSAIEFDSNIPRSNLWSWFACRWWANGYNNFLLLSKESFSFFHISPVFIPGQRGVLNR